MSPAIVGAGGALLEKAEDASGVLVVAEGSYEGAAVNRESLGAPFLWEPALEQRLVAGYSATRKR